PDTTAPSPRRPEGTAPRRSRAADARRAGVRDTVLPSGTSRTISVMGSVGTGRERRRRHGVEARERGRDLLVHRGPLTDTRAPPPPPGATPRAAGWRV